MPPGARMVKGFNALLAPLRALPIAEDDSTALNLLATLDSDFGLEAVHGGLLAES